LIDEFPYLAFHTFAQIGVWLSGPCLDDLFGGHAILDMRESNEHSYWMMG